MSQKKLRKESWEKKADKRKVSKRKLTKKNLRGGNIHPLPQKNFMEKTSFDYLWELLSPSPGFNNVQNSCRGFWNALTLQRQRLIFYTLREQKRRGEPFKENPLFTLQDCNPRPTDWNGRQGINEKIKSEKMVIAKYQGSYGTYTLQEAKLFGMTELKPLNFHP